MLGLALFYALAIVTFVRANTTHVTAGTGGTHSSGSHSINPGHIQATVGLPHSGSISSGGRYHDSCAGSACYPAFGGDYAQDIAAAGGTDTKLYPNYNGVGLSPNPNVDLDRNIVIKAKVLDQQGTGACQYQKYAVLATYWGVDGVQYVEKSIAYLWLMHQTGWVYSVNDIIPTNASYGIPGHSGTVSWINGIKVSDVYSGGGSCSTGSHTHAEAFNRHAWGGQIEWHSGSGPDGFSGLTCCSDHIHYGSGYNHGAADDSATIGNDLWYVGGGRTEFRMMDNPYSGITRLAVSREARLYRGLARHTPSSLKGGSCAS
jgi:hypothetical protein